MLFALYCNVVLGVGMIYVALQGRVDDDPMTIKDAVMQYLLITNSMFIYARAAINAIFKRYVGFVRTSKAKSQTGYALIRWNLLVGAFLLASSIYSLYQAAIASDLQQTRTYLPISVWLLMYAMILLSSIIFVADETPGAAVKTGVHA
jgi:hypothetical protein